MEYKPHDFVADDAADRILVVLVGLLLDTVASIWAGRLLAAAVVDKDHSQRPVGSDCRMHRSSLEVAERRFVRDRTYFDSVRLADHTFDLRPAVDNCLELVDVKRPAAYRDDTLVVHRMHSVDSLAVHRTVALHQGNLLADRLGLCKD